MKVLQALFEDGHITYHRTDSPALSEEGILAARAIIAHTFPDCLPLKSNRHNATGNAQEAHEAIRPTHPETGRDALLPSDEADLYRMIWDRFVASQMTPGKDQITRIILSIDDEGETPI